MLNFNCENRDFQVDYIRDGQETLIGEIFYKNQKSEWKSFSQVEDQLSTKFVWSVEKSAVRAIKSHLEDLQEEHAWEDCVYEDCA